MNHNLILNTGFMVNRLNNFELFFKFLKSIKINNIQLTVSIFNFNIPYKKLMEDVMEFKKLSINNNIQISSVFTDAYSRLNHLSNLDKSISDYWYNKFKIFIKITSILGAKNFGSHLGIMNMNESLTNKKNILNNTISKWVSLSEHASKLGLSSLSWEPMSISREFGETINQTKKINNLLNQKSSIPIKLCLDVDHGDKQKSSYNANPYNWIRDLAKYSYCIHLKQVKKNHNSSHLCFSKNNNKSGIINSDKILKLLNDQNINNMNLVLEHSFKERSDVEKNLKKNMLESINYWKLSLLNFNNSKK